MQSLSISKKLFDSKEFIWEKSTNKFEAKLQEKTLKLIGEINTEFKTNFNVENPKTTTQDLQSLLDLLNQKKEEEKINFIKGKGKRKHKIQRLIESIEEFLENQNQVMKQKLQYMSARATVGVSLNQSVQRLKEIENLKFLKLL